MNDVKCPYCDMELEIDHDDGYGYEEDQIHNQECKFCGKAFVYTTSVCFYPVRRKTPSFRAGI